jgi:YegS/Rv2252/BmrU family lipid kinase
MKVRFIYNPASGVAAAAGRLDEISRLYVESGYTIEPRHISFEEGAEDGFLGGLDDTYHHILVAGGDGTVNYIVNLLMVRGIDIPVAFLPMGTANDFASMIGMPRNIKDACKAILEGRERRIDIGYVNGRYFVNVFSCGLFTDVSQKTPTFFKNNFGKLAYYVSGISDIPRFRKMHLSIRTDGGDFEGKALIFFVFNGRTAGRLPIAYLSEIDDGLLDVLIVKGDAPLETIGTLVRYFPYMRFRDKYPSGIVHLRCTRLVAHSPRNERTDVDGQPGAQFPLDMRCLPGALRVITGK